MAARNNTEEGDKRTPLELEIGSDAIASPHSIELSRNKKGFTKAIAYSLAERTSIGAKTVENILREAGADLPAGEDKLLLTFSPDTGELIAAAKK